MAMTRTRLTELRTTVSDGGPNRHPDDVQGFTIPWRRVAVALLLALGVFASWFVTTNTYAALWQQQLENRWASVVARGEPLEAAPADGQPVAALSIPSLGVHRIVLAGTDRATLRKAPGLKAGNALPGGIGNTVILGHRLLWSAPFRRLDSLGFGAPIYLQLSDGTVARYLVAGIFHMDFADPAIESSESQRPVLTLVTSDPAFRADRVLVIKAVMPPEVTP